MYRGKKDCTSCVWDHRGGLSDVIKIAVYNIIFPFSFGAAADLRRDGQVRQISQDTVARARPRIAAVLNSMFGRDYGGVRSVLWASRLLMRFECESHWTALTRSEEQIWVRDLTAYDSNMRYRWRPLRKAMCIIQEGYLILMNWVLISGYSCDKRTAMKLR